MKRIFLLATLLSGQAGALESDFAETNLGWSLFLHRSATNPGESVGFITSDDSPSAQGGFLNVPNLTLGGEISGDAVTWMGSPSVYVGNWANSTSVEVALEVRTTSGETTRPIAFFLMDSTGNNRALFEFSASLTPSTPGVVTLIAPLSEEDWTVTGDWKTLINDVAGFYVRADLQRGLNQNEFLGVDRVERIDGPIVVESTVNDAMMVEFYAPIDVEVQLERSTNLDRWDFVESFLDLDDNVSRCFVIGGDSPAGYFRTQTYSLSSSGDETFGTLDLNFELVELRDRTTIFRAPLDLPAEAEVLSLTLSDNNLQLGAAGVFSGFDLDFALVDADGDINTTEDQGTTSFDSELNFFSPGTTRTDPDFPFDATTLHPGTLFGLNENDVIDPTVTTLGVLDAAYDLPLTVDSSNGFLSLGDGGALSLDLPFSDVLFGSDPHLFIGEVGMTDGENLSASMEYSIFEPFAPVVEPTLSPAVEISFDASPRTIYQTQVSVDGITWSNLGEQITSPGTLETRCYKLEGISGRRFRVIIFSTDLLEQ